MEQPASALRFLEEARGLGVPEGELAADLGLAHDLLGDPAAAQRDYAVAMRSNDTDELRRRLALSRAISGDRNGALAVLQDQLARKDRAGWRVRAFVLALTGDAAAATEAARAVMPQQAAAMQPFFSRLPTLGRAERAMAVHFGRFPGDPPAQAFEAPPGYASLSPNVTAAGRPSSGQAGFQAPAASRPTTSTLNETQLATRSDRAFSQPLPSARPVFNQPAPPQTPRATSRSAEPARAAPERSAEPARAAPARSQPVQVASAPPVRTEVQPQRTRPSTALPELDRSEGIGMRSGLRPRARPSAALGSALARSRPSPEPERSPARLAANTTTPQVSPRASDPVRTGPVQGPPDGGTRPSAVTITTPALTPAPTPAPTSAAEPVAVPPALTPPVAAPVFSGPLPGAAPASTAPGISALDGASAPAAVAPPAASAPAAPATSPSTGLSGLSAVAATIQQLPEETASPKPESSSTKPAPAAEPDKAATAKADTAGQPSRHWVQVAGTADKESLRGEFARIRAKAPKLLADKSAWTTPLRFTNRLLVGPFKSNDEAQDFVNELAKADLSAFTWTSPAGQEIVKLAGK